MGEPSKKYEIVPYKVNQSKSEHEEAITAERTEYVEATGLPGIIDALPGVGNDDGSAVSAFDGAAVVDNFADGVATYLGLKATKNTVGQAIIYSATNYMMLEVAQCIFDSVGGFTGGNTLGFSIAQLKVIMCKTQMCLKI